MDGDPFAGNRFGVVTMDDDFFKGMNMSNPFARKITNRGMTDDDFS